MKQSNEKRAKALNKADRKWLDVENTIKFRTFLDDHVKAIRG